MPEDTFLLKMRGVAGHFAPWEIPPDACICAIRTLAASTAVHVVHMQLQVLDSYRFRKDHVTERKEKE